MKNTTNKREYNKGKFSNPKEWEAHKEQEREREEAEEPLNKPISLELDLALNSYLYRLREAQEFEARKNSSGLFWFVIAVLVAVLSWAFF